jgi:pyruvate formate lyase activating enzyme
MKKEALFFKVENGKVRCSLCPHNCLISKDNRGICGVRECSEEDNQLKLFTVNYGEITSASLDPVKKKPLYHFYPDKNIFSIGTFGCNFKCSFCQNHSISQKMAESQYIPVEDMVNIILKQEDSIGLAFTYNEPSIWFEYIYDVAREIKKKDKDCKIVLVTNGYISEEPLRLLLPYIDAMNIDLKGDDEFYKRICLGTLEPVKDTIKLANSLGCHIEVTTLLISGENSSYETVNALGDFIASVNKDIVLHVSRYFPGYRMDRPKTELDDLKNAYKQLKAKLNFVYIGNVNSKEMAYIIGT